MIRSLGTRSSSNIFENRTMPENNLNSISLTAFHISIAYASGIILFLSYFLSKLGIIVGMLVIISYLFATKYVLFHLYMLSRKTDKNSIIDIAATLLSGNLSRLYKASTFIMLWLIVLLNICVISQLSKPLIESMFDCDHEDCYGRSSIAQGIIVVILCIWAIRRNNQYDERTNSILWPTALVILVSFSLHELMKLALNQSLSQQFKLAPSSMIEATRAIPMLCSLFNTPSNLIFMFSKLHNPSATRVSTSVHQAFVCLVAVYAIMGSFASILGHDNHARMFLIFTAKPNNILSFICRCILIAAIMSSVITTVVAATTTINHADDLLSLKSVQSPDDLSIAIGEISRYYQDCSSADTDRIDNLHDSVSNRVGFSDPSSSSSQQDPQDLPLKYLLKKRYGSTGFYSVCRYAALQVDDEASHTLDSPNDGIAFHREASNARLSEETLSTLQYSCMEDWTQNYSSRLINYALICAIILFAASVVSLCGDLSYIINELLTLTGLLAIINSIIILCCCYLSYRSQAKLPWTKDS
jgi:intracellular septation protein A